VANHEAAISQGLPLGRPNLLPTDCGFPTNGGQIISNHFASFVDQAVISVWAVIIAIVGKRRFGNGVLAGFAEG
jgi:hypothetical protein